VCAIGRDLERGDGPESAIDVERDHGRRPARASAIGRERGDECEPAIGFDPDRALRWKSPLA
jgi:hypothetical protein